MPRRTRTHRRDFLKGRAAVEAVADLTHGTGTLDAEPTSKRGHLVHFARRAMATRFEVLLNAGEDSVGPEAALAALDKVDELESQLTVYRDDSEVMHINRTAAQEPVLVEPRLFELLQTAVALFDETGGAFDITSGPLIKTWGFYRRRGDVPSADNLAVTLAQVGSQHIELDEQSHTIRFAHPALEINLGAIGKGYALDRAAELLLAAGVADFVLHGGQSSVVASGRHRGSSNDQPGWPVAIKHPLRTDAQLAQIRLVDRAAGTSSATFQFFRHQGRRYGHLLDPRTGWPAEGVLQTTVLAPTAALADALSTAFFVLGWDKSREYCQRHPELAVLMVLPGPRDASIRVETAGFDAGELS